MSHAETVTEAQIEQLRTEAAQAGDLLQSAICTMALQDRNLTEAEIDSLDPGSKGPADWDHLDTHPLAARSVCARVIAEAQR